MKLVVKDIPPWDGEYDMDFVFTNREMHRIKQLSGLRGGEVMDALMNDDWGGFVAVSVVVLNRHGKSIDPDDLWEAQAGSLRIVASEDDAGPPDEPTSGGASNGPDANAPSSGPTSSGTGENPAQTPGSTGSPGSETSAA